MKRDRRNFFVKLGGAVGIAAMTPQFTEVIGRHFRPLKEGLGFNSTPVAHRWRSIATPDHSL